MKKTIAIAVTIGLAAGIYTAFMHNKAEAPGLEATPAASIAAASSDAPAANNTPAPATDWPLPPELLVDGQPADPLCFAAQTSMESETSRYELKNCVAEGLVNIEALEKGPASYGISYDYKDAEGMGMSKPYMMIQYPGKKLEDMDGNFPPTGDKGIPLILRYNTGGTGQFSSLMTVKREGDALIVTGTLAGGDRCNGGVTEAWTENDGSIRYDQNITPYDMIVLGGDANRPALQSIKAYDDVAACAACCYGSAQYKGDTLIGIKFYDGLKESVTSANYENPAEHTKQICFDAALARQIDTGKTQFTPEEWRGFIAGIETECFTYGTDVTTP